MGKKKHVPAKAREPRPKGAQRGVARRDNQKGGLNFGEGYRAVTRGRPGRRGRANSRRTSR